MLDRTHRAEEAIRASNVVVGYKHYLNHIADLIEGKELLSTGMRQEVDRCRAALDRASQGDTVAFVSSGDAGVYGMAGLAIEMAAAHGIDVPIEIVPGISAANSAAARFGAPLMLDYACVSLSDLLMPWETIRRRLEALAGADMVVALYNPKSTKRVCQIEEAAALFRQHRPGNTPVGIATAVGAEDERLVLSDLDHFLGEEITMKSIVIIGNSSSKILDGWFVTPRGYKV
ncbi:MAG: precorrin-3B C(17)-methyltransferase [Chthoniobacteraceae bacterium]|nr:precorrin-3B C(17)-methyltransferase [Chthoniobacteraceae bacterium]